MPACRSRSGDLPRRARARGARRSGPTIPDCSAAGERRRVRSRSCARGSRRAASRRAADPELAQPLPPLNQFDVREVELAAARARRGAGRAALRDQGRGARRRRRRDRDRRLPISSTALSALRDGKGKAANEAMLSARLTEDSKLLQRILQAEGWYDAQVRHAHRPLARPPTASRSPRCSLSRRASATRSADRGQRRRRPCRRDLIDDNLALKVGEPIVAQRVQGAEANVAVVLPQQGYPVRRGRPARHPARSRNAPWRLHAAGRRSARARASAGSRTTGELAFDAEHVEVLARFKRGELYDSRKVDDLRQALVATGLFSTVAVEPQRTGAAGRRRHRIS